MAALSRLIDLFSGISEPISCTGLGHDVEDTTGFDKHFGHWSDVVEDTTGFDERFAHWSDVEDTIGFDERFAHWSDVFADTTGFDELSGHWRDLAEELQQVISEKILALSYDATHCTSEFNKASGRGWKVIDTVGFGEAEAGVVSNAQAGCTSWSWNPRRWSARPKLERIISNWHDGADEKSTLIAGLIKFLEKEVMSFGVTANGKSTLANAQKKVLMFGRTGEGKSAIANALVTGGIEQVVFPWNDGAAGCTSEVKKASGRGWTVTDTVGLGGAETGAISNAEAQERLTAYLKMVRGQYSHIIFVQKANRVTVMDDLNWQLFRSIFEGAEEAFVILFTSADENWLKDNKDGLPSYMEGVQTLTADIPPISKRRVAEKRRTAIREKSILKLEEELVKIFEQGGNKYSIPKISLMTDEELEEKAASLRQFVANTIRSMFVPQMWLTVALKLSSLVSVIDLILPITDTA
ncbi:unnamed protein product [Calypogeia fissa]